MQQIHSPWKNRRHDLALLIAIGFGASPPSRRNSVNFSDNIGRDLGIDKSDLPPGAGLHSNVKDNFSGNKHFGSSPAKIGDTQAMAGALTT